VGIIGDISVKGEEGIMNQRQTKWVGIVGLGRVGSALAFSLQHLGYEIVVASRRFSPGQKAVIRDRQFAVVSLAEIGRKADLLFLATPDGIITKIAEKLAQDRQLAGKGVLHLSGAHSSKVLEPLRKTGAFLGSLHPLQSFANVEQAIENLPGSYFTYQGDEALLGEVAKLVQDLNGFLKILQSPESKVVYHAGACLVSNYLVALASLGVRCLSEAGFSEEEARRALTPLMQGTVNNIAALPLTKALTGPIVRGDLAVVRNHLKALSAELPEVRQAYRVLSPLLGKLALEGNNIKAEVYEELLGILGDNQR
jgi:predicted short-subunit dehydrogenase-like oxidoreductase (DUF2520 family)